MGKETASHLRRKRPDQPAAQVPSGDATQARVENRGIWKRFFHTLMVAKVPYLMLLVYIILNMLQSQIIIRVPKVSGNFFAGDVSAKSVGLFIGAELLITAVSTVVNYFNQRLRAKTDRNLRNVLWGKILRLKPRYYDRVSASTLLSRITVDIDSLNTFFMDIILDGMFSIYTMILTVNEMSGISRKAAVILLVFAPLSLLISFVTGRLNLRFENAAKFKLASLTDYLSELVSSLPVVKAFNQQKHETGRGAKVVDDYYIASRNLTLLDIGKQLVGAVSGILPEIVIIMMGVRMLKDSTLDPAGWYMFYAYAGSLLTLVGVFGGLWEKVKSVQGQLNRVSEVLFEEEEGIETYVKESGDILFDNVTFRYDDTLALDKVSFTIPERKTTALVGYSGSGKSTVLKLLERVYDPDEGRILLRGSAPKDYDSKAWREKIAFVPQNAPMISGTIRENVLYGIRREVRDEEILEAARLVDAEQFILSHPQGLDRQVGQFGSKLSGGQRQKLCIARAILRKADYLILDESTASLDILATEEDEEYRRGVEANNAKYQADVRRLNRFIFQAPVGTLAQYINQVILLLVATAMVRAGAMKMSQMLNLYNYFLLFMSNAFMINAVWQNLKLSHGACSTIARLMELEDEQLDGPIPVKDEEQDIVFDHVSFAYTPDQYVLKDVSFTIPKGKVTAIVGENGSGKSTIIKLLERFNEPTSGVIRLGEDDLKDVNLAQWRSAVGYLFQSDQLVKGTIRENVCYGLDRLWTEEEIQRAVELARAEEFIQSKPAGLDAAVSRFDNKLSGGELQRVAIVRIILRQPQYLIMDEATSGIDVVSESEVLEGLSNMMKGKTVVMVSHDMNLIGKADHIIVLNKGVIEASGSFQEVSEQSELFRQLVAV